MSDSTTGDLGRGLGRPGADVRLDFELSTGQKFGSCESFAVRVITVEGRPFWPCTDLEGAEMVQVFLHSDWVYVVALAFLFVVFAAPTAIAVIRGTEFDPLICVIVFSVIPMGLPGAYLMAIFAPGRVREEPPVRLPPDPRFLRDPRYPRDDPRARWPLP